MNKVARLSAIDADVFTVSANASQGEKILKGKIAVKRKSFQDAGCGPTCSNC